MSNVKDLRFAKEAKQSMLNGIEKLSKAVKATLGPCGRNVVIESESGGASTITKDGVSVARQVVLEDSFENIGAALVKEVAAKTANAAGDGTTTATVLAESIYKHGLQALTTGLNANEIKRGIDYAVNAIVDELKKISTDVAGDKDKIVNVARVSANGDKEIGTVIANAIDTVGIDGTVTVSDSKTAETYFEIIKGMEFSNGYLSPYFINNEQKGNVELNDCLILLYGKKISTINELVPILNHISQQKRPLLIITDDIDNEALTTVVLNKMRGVLSVCIVKSPSFGDIRKEVMQDIAVLTNGTYLSEEFGVDLENINFSYLGQAKRAIITNNSTTILDGAGDEEALAKRVSNIQARIANAANEYEAKVLKRRLSKLTNGVAMIYAGANTVIELNQKKDRIDDALHATIAALEEGIVPGGGVALVRAGILAKKNIKTELKNYSEAFRHGVNIIFNAINEPLKQIAMNGGYSGDVVLNKICLHTNINYGFDALNNKYTDLVNAGIIDPVKVTRTAIESAASIAGLLLTTECVIANKPVEPPQMMPMMPPMGGMPY